jgi:hypothetical protein
MLVRIFFMTVLLNPITFQADSCGLETKIINSDFVISTNKKEIPKRFLQLMKHRLNHKVSFADPNERYNETDLQNPKLPSIQLIEIGNNVKLGLLVLICNVGGYSLHKEAYLFGYGQDDIEECLEQLIIPDSVCSVRMLKSYLVSLR